MIREPAGIRRALLRWYDANRRALPWRRDRNSYRVWVAEVMLQQTRIEVVIPAYRRFLLAFPTLAKLAAASEDEVLSLWSGLGYYSRARALHRAARLLVDSGACRFPRDYEAARKLPGVGPYTAAAVLSIAHGLPHAAVDGNVVRVLSRLACLLRPDSKGEPHAALADRRAPRPVPPGRLEPGGNGAR
jgi:A/G-specific adenine glycosylase